ncbi:MAG: hypothetical protein LC640_09135 [Frankia sp.]|nr:hypothetical protein [Frankia sp.]
MTSTIRGESLLATTGVTAALRPGPVSITMKVLRKAEGLPTHVRRAMRRFCRAPELADVPDLPEWDYDEVIALLPNAQNEVRQVENVSGFYDIDLAMEYAESLGTAVGYLQSIAPVEPMVQMVATERTGVRPGELDVSEFRRRYAVVDRPLTALDALCAGILVPEEVEALSTVYPELYAAMRTSLEQEMIAAVAAKESYRLPYAKQTALEVFLQTETVDAALSAELGKAFESARQRESAGKKPPKDPGAEPQLATPRDPTNPATQTDKLEAR